MGHNFISNGRHVYLTHFNYRRRPSYRISSN